jgi:aryl carrier-like protein
MDITRLNTTLPYVDAEIKRGEEKGSHYPCLEISEENLQQVIKHIGPDIVAAMLQAKVSQFCQNCAYEATDDVTKQLDSVKFIDLVQQWSARGESMKELQEKLQDLVLTLPGITDPLKLQEAIARSVSVSQAIESKKRKKDTVAA